MEREAEFFGMFRHINFTFLSESGFSKLVVLFGEPVFSGMALEWDFSIRQFLPQTFGAVGDHFRMAGTICTISRKANGFAVAGQSGWISGIGLSPLL